MPSPSPRPMSAAGAVLLLIQIAVADGIDVVILAGESNMVGYGDTDELPEEFQEAQTDVAFNVLDRGDGWTVLQPGSGHDFGPEITFGRRMADLLAPRRIGLIKFAADGSSLAQDWHPDVGRLYPRLTQGVDQAMADLRRRGDSPHIVAMLWMQGESDAGDQQWAHAYETNLAGFVTRVREDLAAPDMRFVIGRINAPGLPYRDVVRAAQDNVAQSTADAGLVATDDLPLRDDMLRYDTPGQIELGYRFAVETNNVLCEAIRRFAVRCREGILRGKVESSLPRRTAMTVDRNRAEQAILRIHASGRGRVRFVQQLGIHVLRILECPEFFGAVQCG